MSGPVTPREPVSLDSRFVACKRSGLSDVAPDPVAPHLRGRWTGRAYEDRATNMLSEGLRPLPHLLRTFAALNSGAAPARLPLPRTGRRTGPKRGVPGRR